MHLEVTFKNLKPREEVKKRAQALYKKLERFLDSASDATLVLNVEHGQAVLELVVTVKGEVHKAVEEDEELRTALDKVFHTMEVQLRRGKEKRLAGRREVGDVDGFVPDVGDPVDTTEDAPAQA